MLKTRVDVNFSQQLLICDTEIKPPINQLTLHNGNCLKWKAEKYEEDTELYKVR